MFNSDGPNWEALFSSGALQPASMPEHYELVTRFLNFVKGTPGYQQMLDTYAGKGYRHPDHTPELIAEEAAAALAAEGGGGIADITTTVTGGPIGGATAEIGLGEPGVAMTGMAVDTTESVETIVLDTPKKKKSKKK